MKLIPHWRACLLHAWSSRFIALGFMFETFSQLWAMVPANTRDLVPYGHTLSLVAFGGAFVARLIHQPKLKKEEARQE